MKLKTFKYTITIEWDDEIDDEEASALSNEQIIEARMLDPNTARDAITFGHIINVEAEIFDEESN